MNDTILKSNWERRQEHTELNQDDITLLVVPYKNAAITAVKLLSQGCANTNYHITFSDGESVVLRIYLRDHTAMMREIGIHDIVKNLLPVADILYSDESCNIHPHPYAIMQFMPGILLRDLIFTNDETAIANTMHEAGQYLGMLRALKLPYGGFFEDNMQIRPFTPDEEYEPYLTQLLQNTDVTSSLGNNLCQDIQQLVSQCYHLLPEINDANLTHGDYDPANILVSEKHGQWKISAILDWEFAFSGSYLLDIGMMLRYNHKLPSYVENSFIRGIKDSGPSLPSDWKKQATLMDLLCLLQLLQQNPANERPYLNRDVKQLITYKVKHFTQF